MVQITKMKEKFSEFIRRPKKDIIWINSPIYMNNFYRHGIEVYDTHSYLLEINAIRHKTVAHFGSSQFEQLLAIRIYASIEWYIKQKLRAMLW